MTATAPEKRIGILAWLVGFSLLALLSRLPCPSIQYQGGLNGMPLSLWFVIWMPTVALFLMASWFSTLFVVAGVVLAFKARAWRLASLICLVFVFLVPKMTDTGSQPPPFLLGFKERLLQHQTPEQLEQLADALHAYHPEASKEPVIYGGHNRLTSLSSLTARDTPFPFPDALLKIASRYHDTIVRIEPDLIEIFWGGALVGTWGVRIHASPEDAKHDQGWGRLPLSDRVIVFLSS